MNRFAEMRRKSSLGISVLLFASCVHSALAQTNSMDTAEFRIILNDGQGDQQAYESDVVPLIAGLVCYGWRIHFADADGLVRFREVFSLPEKPEFWSGENDRYSTSEITDDRTTSITEEFAALQDGWVGHSWCVAKGDPEGSHSMEVYIDGQFAKRFEFEVRAVSK